MKKLLIFAACAACIALPSAFGKTGFSISPETASAPAGSIAEFSARFDIPQGSHIYPQATEVGMPTKIEAELPEGFELEKIEFPRPEYFTFMSIKALGYSAPFSAPIKIKTPASAAAKKYALKFKATWLECSETCVPREAAAQATLELSPAPAGAQSCGCSALGGNPRAGSGGALLAAVLGAILGGLILNAMPCVFPVIGLKVMSFASSARDSKISIAINGIVFSIGIILTFAILGAAIALLKYFGGSAGWGFQLQSPAFTLAMAALFWLIALNFAGFWEFGAAVSAKAAEASGAGKLAGSFASGVLAVLVASPCVAPFMASAVGFALAGNASPAESVLVISSVGVGMAIPYMVLAAFPGALRLLPKSGKWLGALKKAMSLPMFAAAAWLAWVSLRQGTAPSALAAMLALSAAAAFVWGRFASPLRTLRTRAAAVCLSAALLAAAFAAALWERENPSEAAAPANAWSPARVEELRRAGKAVFVDFTASWCLTCQYNKQILRSRKVAEIFAKNNIETLVADFTNGGDEISAELKKYSRAGVPLYLLYPADPSAKPEILPALLTVSAVAEAVDKIKQ